LKHHLVDRNNQNYHDRVAFLYNLFSSEEFLKYTKMSIFHLFVLIIASILLEAVVVQAQDNSQCQTCLRLWNKLSSLDKTGRCLNVCKKDQEKENENFFLDPPCNRKCCRRLCRSNNAEKVCRAKGYCTRTDSPSSSPTETPTVAPTSVPIVIDDPVCAEKLECLACVEVRRCFFKGGNGMGSCSDCQPLKSRCDTDTGYCKGISFRTPDICEERLKEGCEQYL